MAGDWIKMRTDLYRDPKVCIIADCLMQKDSELARYVDQNCQRDMTVTRNVMRNVTVGALVSVWGVMRQQGRASGQSLLCSGATIEVIDDIADLPGFGAAMALAGWVVETEDGIEFPRFFDEHNVDPAASKASASAERQRRYRERQKAVTCVTSDVTRDVTVTHREEKRREEKKEKEEQPRKRAPSKSAMPNDFSVSDRVKAWAAEKGHDRLDQHLESFRAKATAKGYTYADWDAAFMEAIRENWAKLPTKVVQLHQAGGGRREL